MKKIAILVHGLGRSRLSMLLIGQFLKRKGFYPLYYPYRSTRDNLEGHFAKFADYIASTATANPDAEIHFVTHSMGGIITRGALSPALLAEIPRPGRIVMLAPPNQGSRAATIIAGQKIISKILKPLKELADSADSKIHTVPVPKDVEIGIISGQFDAKVRPHEAALTGAKEHITVKSAHTFIMNSPKVMNAVFNFLNTGSFSTAK